MIDTKQILEDMKKGIKNNTTTNAILQKMVAEGIEEDDALDIMINTWADKMTKKILGGVPPRQGKSVFGSVDCTDNLTNEDKQKILEGAFNSLFNPKCPKCGANLPRYPFYGYNGKFRVCYKCNTMVKE